MKNTALTIAFLALSPLAATAQPIDIIGGADGSTQTIHHCGFLPTSGQRYTDSPVLVEIIESKLAALGYLHAAGNGTYGKADKAAVKQFQMDWGLTPDGVVGPLTAQKLAFASNPSAHVRSCYRLNNGAR